MSGVRVGKARQAFYFQKRDETAFAFAGIWDRWRNGELGIRPAAIVTTEANELLTPVHDACP
jgi:putative SOS response-associated peptidase YedK